jgi:hypothetical protein
MEFGISQLTGSVFAPGQVDTLGSVVSPASATPTITVAQALNTYNAIAINVHNPGGATVGYARWASVVGTNSPMVFSGAFPAQPTVAALGLPNVYTVIGCINNIGDQLIITVAFTVAPPTGTSITAYGLTGPRPQPIRPDGRNYPMGSWNTNFFQVPGGPYTALNTLGTTERYLLRTMALRNAGSGVTTSIDITGTINGVSAHIGGISGAGQGAQETSYESGILLDPGTGATYSVGAGGSNGGGSCYYDIVPA